MFRCLSIILWLKGFALFALFGVIGYLLGVRHPAPIPNPATPAQITLHFHGFNKDGDRVEAIDENKGHLSTDDYLFSRDPGVKVYKEFKPQSSLYKEWKRTVVVPTHDEYMKWLDDQEKELTAHMSQKQKTFWQEKFQKYRENAGPKDKKSFDYPVIFDNKL